MKTKSIRSGLIFFVLSLATTIVFAQQLDYSILAGPYFGQKPPGVKPEIFAPGIVSSKEFVESNCLVWDNGAHILFFRINVGKLEASLFTSNEWQIARETTTWRGPTLLHCISPDGNTMFYNYFGNLPDGTKPKGTPIFKRQKQNGTWSDELNTMANGMWPSVDVSGNLFYTVRINGLAQIARRDYYDGNYGNEDVLQFPNDEMIEFMHPCIAHDGSYIIMDAENNPHQNGCELYISFRSKDGLWSKPKNMGDIIKLKGAAMARISSDGKYILFQAEGDIYWVSIKIIDELKP